MTSSKRKNQDGGGERGLTYRASALRGHLKDCRVCASAVRAGQWGAFCAKGTELSAKFALAWDIVLDMKKSAGPDVHGLVYACPEIAAHGEAYALTAELWVVSGSQEMLF